MHHVVAWEVIILACSVSCCLLIVLQIVILAAGFDTRAYRLHRPGVKFYEVDLPHASAKKQDLVETVLSEVGI